ncbi:MAG: histidine phosphatase family protein [Desulfopila sp.]|jgi:probable phosphoglycerate mutase|nr:histidine phosphatase family protein [Desulfopila sp.]
MEIEQHRHPGFSRQNTFGLLRHGITLWNEEKRIQGSLDSELSPTGIENTVRWAENLKPQKWTRILASDLGRARQTVSILNTALALPTTCDKRLRELHWGEWEGIKLKDISIRNPDVARESIDAGWDFRPPGGESRREGLMRVQAALADAASLWPNENILVVSHHGILKCLIFHILKLSFIPGEVISLNKNALHRIFCRHGSYSCDKLNILPDPPS